MTKERLPWFTCYPSKLLGALAEMDPKLGYVYVVILLRIYERGGACPDSVEAISNRTKLSRRAVEAAIEALVNQHRLIRTADGFMNPVAESVLANSNQLRSQRKQVGKKGGLAKAEKIKEKQQNRPSKSLPTAKQTPTQIHLQEQEQRKEKKDSTPSGAELPLAVAANGVCASWPSDFRERFWSIYPRKIAKRAAIAALEKVQKSGEVEFATVVAGVTRLIAKIKRDRTEERFIKHPATWLNGGCWDDEFGPPSGGGEPHGIDRQGGGDGRLTHGALAAKLRAQLAH